MVQSGKITLPRHNSFYQQDGPTGTDLSHVRGGLGASCLRAAGEAARQIGDAVGAAHGADGGGETVAVTEALSRRRLAGLQSPDQRHTEGDYNNYNQDKAQNKTE